MRRYAEPVEMRHRDGTPDSFVWRGRCYRVCAVLAHWTDQRPWWQGAAAARLLGLTGADPPGIGVGPAEGEVWRVEARAGATAPAGVYDVRQDATDGVWSIVRALD
jgi:hypothetical protein